MAKMNIKSGDEVVVISGKDKGKKGKVIEVLPKTGKTIVEGVAVATMHKKPKAQGQTGGIIKQELAIDCSNVMVVCAKCKKATRAARKVLEDGSSVRYCKKCGETFND